MTAADTFRCHTCGEIHGGPPLAYGGGMPEPWYAIPGWQRPFRARVSKWGELCAIDRKWFFVRGRIPIPVVDANETFYWGVWVSVAQLDFDEIKRRWADPKRAEQSPYLGWLMTRLPYEQPTVELKTSLQMQPPPERPLVTLEPSEHELAREQQNGIDMDRVREFAAALMHPDATLR